MQQLFTEFTPTTAAQWKEQLIKDLKGIDYNTLVWKTNAGIDVQPFYTKENITITSVPAFNRNDWAICEAIAVENEKEANAQALNALQNGASGLVFYVFKQTNFSVLLKGILLEHIYSLFKVVPEQEKELESFLSSINKGSTCFVEFDELLNEDVGIGTMAQTICINASLYQEAGSNTINELAFSIAHLNEYLNEASSNNQLSGITQVHVSVSVGGDFFMEISKLRALRKLINFLVLQYQINPTVHIHAQTTSINKSVIDSYTNMLRSTTEAMSASIGGANSILVLPFDSEFNQYTDFSSRMARNQQLILKDESYLNLVADISAGSYYIETITESLSEKSWEQFKVIESKGGLCACLTSGYIQDLISKDANILANQFKEGKLVLVGVNKFQPKEIQNPIHTTNPFNSLMNGTLRGINPIKLADFI